MSIANIKRLNSYEMQFELGTKYTYWMQDEGDKEQRIVKKYTVYIKPTDQIFNNKIDTIVDYVMFNDKMVTSKDISADGLSHQIEEFKGKVSISVKFKKNLLEDKTNKDPIFMGKVYFEKPAIFESVRMNQK